MPQFDGFGALYHALHEAFVNAFLHQNARGAGTHLALIEGKHNRAFEAFVEEIVIGVHDAFKENVGRFAAEFQRDGHDVFGGILHDELAGSGFAGEGHFIDTRTGSERFAGFDAETIDDVEHAGRQDAFDEFHEDHDSDRRLFGGLQHDAIACSQCGRYFPGSHQQREVPGDDLRHYAQRFQNVHGNGIGIQLTDGAFFSADDAGEIAEVVNGQREVGGAGFAEGLAVVPGFGAGQRFEVGLHHIGNFEEEIAAGGSRGGIPGRRGSPGGIKGQFDVFFGRAGHFGKDLAVHRREVFKVLSAHGGRPFASDEVVVLVFEFWFFHGVGGGGENVAHVNCLFS